MLQHEEWVSHNRQGETDGPHARNFFLIQDRDGNVTSLLQGTGNIATPSQAVNTVRYVWEPFGRAHPLSADWQAMPLEQLWHLVDHGFHGWFSRDFVTVRPTASTGFAGGRHTGGMSKSTSRSGKGPSRDSSKEKFWRKTLADHAAAGGLSVRAFCRARGLSEPSFYGWRRTLDERDRGHAHHEAGSPSAGFVELRPSVAAVTPPVPDCAPLEIVTASHRLLIRGGCDRQLLRDVLWMLVEWRSQARPTSQEA